MASLSADTGSASVEPPQALDLLIVGGIGLVSGTVLRVARWGVLRGKVDRAWRWLPADAVAWAVGMPLIFEGIDLARKAGSVLAAILVMAATIALTGAVVGESTALSSWRSPLREGFSSA